MTDNNKKQDEDAQTDKPMRADDRIWGDDLKPGSIEIEEAEIEDDEQ